MNAEAINCGGIQRKGSKKSLVVTHQQCSKVDSWGNEWGDREEVRERRRWHRDHTSSKFSLKHCRVVKSAGPIIHGWDFSFSLLQQARKQPKTLELCQMMERNNYAPFIGHLIPAMTDAAPSPKVFPFALSCGKTEQWREASARLPLKGRPDKIFMTWRRVTFNRGLLTCSREVWLLQPAYLLCNK